MCATFICAHVCSKQQRELVQNLATVAWINEHECGNRLKVRCDLDTMDKDYKDPERTTLYKRIAKNCDEATMKVTIKQVVPPPPPA